MAAALARLRALERAHGGQRCPERGGGASSPPGASPATTRSTRWPSARRWPVAASCPATSSARPARPRACSGPAAPRTQERRGSPTCDRGGPRRSAARATAARAPLLPGLRPAAGRAQPTPSRAPSPPASACRWPRRAARPAAATPAAAPTRPGYGSDETVVTACPACDRSLRGGRHPHHAALGGAGRPRPAQRPRPARGGRGLRALRRLPGRARPRPRRAGRRGRRSPTSTA